MIRMPQSVDSTQAIAENDAIAVERTLAGDRDAYRVLVERHSHNIFRLAYRMTGNRHDAEEVVQEAFLRGYQKLGQFASRANFGTWVYRIAANYAIDRMRQRQKEEARREMPRTEDRDAMENDPLTRVKDEAPTPERLTQSIELRKQMEQALAALTEAERTAFVMRHWEGCGIEEIAEQRAVISEHLAACEKCQGELERIEAVLAALDTLPVPEPGADYRRLVWRAIAPRLAEKPGRWWQAWFEPRRLAAAGAVVALIVAAFVAGRITKRVNTSDNVASKEQVRERVLVVAVGEHLGHSERMLVELSNAAPIDPKQKEVNISAEQRRAEDLLQENRLYRQTALQEGDAGLANVLDELERVLLDVAHSPEEVTPAQLEAIQKKIEARGILFKVRVVNKELQQRQEAAPPAPAQNESSKRERNKV